MKTQRGIALFQVLLLSTILTVLLLSLQHRAREDVRLAQAVQEFAEASVLLQSAESKVFQVLLTQDLFELGQRTVTPYQAYNFYGEPFLLDNVEVEIQDTSGLISATAPGADMLIAMARSMFGTPETGLALFATLRDWQDIDQQKVARGAEQSDYPSEVKVRNSGLQFIEELQRLKGVTPQIYSAFRPWLTLYMPDTNLNNQPEALWRMYLPEQKVKQLVELRNRGQLTPTLFQTLTGIQFTEFEGFGYGPVFKIRFTAIHGNVKLAKEVVVKINPSLPDPIEIYEVKFRNLPPTHL